MPRTSFLDENIMDYLESIMALQQPTPGIPSYPSKKYTEAVVKFEDILNTTLWHHSLPRVNDIEKMHHNKND